MTRWDKNPTDCLNVILLEQSTGPHLALTECTQEAMHGSNYALYMATQCSQYTHLTSFDAAELILEARNYDLYDDAVVGEFDYVNH